MFGRYLSFKVMPSLLKNIAHVLPLTLLLFAFIIGIFCYQDDDLDSQYCGEKRDKLQLTYVLDCTTSFTSAVMAAGNSIFKGKSPFIAYGSHQLGFVCFSDYPEAIGPTGRQRGKPKPVHSTEEYCYWPKLNISGKELRWFPQKLGAFAGSMQNDKNDVQSSLTALVFAAASKTLGWSKPKFDAKDLKVRKIIVLATDQPSTTNLTKLPKRSRGNQTNGGRVDIKGDGTDSCSSTMPPTPEIVERILIQQDITVIGVFANPTTVEYYRDYFSRLNVPYLQREIVLGNEHEHLAEMEKVFKEAIETGIDLAEGGECEESDPVAYNTLGL